MKKKKNKLLKKSMNEQKSLKTQLTNWISNKPKFKLNLDGKQEKKKWPWNVHMNKRKWTVNIANGKKKKRNASEDKHSTKMDSCQRILFIGRGKVGEFYFSFFVATMF